MGPIVSTSNLAQSLADRVVFVTGANGGLGAEFVRQALERGAKRVYASSRGGHVWSDQRVIPITLDVTDPSALQRAVHGAPDVQILINNAGTGSPYDLSIAKGHEEVLRGIFETNFFGTLRVAKAFVPILSANGGGTIVNVLSVASWISIPTAYAASKAAMWSASNSLRCDLKVQGIHVLGVHVGLVDTPMTASVQAPKVTAQSVVSQAYEGLSEGVFEVLADATAREVKLRLGNRAEELYDWFDSAL